MLHCCNVVVYGCCRDIVTLLSAVVVELHVVTAVLLVLLIPVTLALKEFLL
jgi:hypothetical protein